LLCVTATGHVVVVSSCGMWITRATRPGDAAAVACVFVCLFDAS
jgi:hypothetical protein